MLTTVARLPAPPRLRLAQAPLRERAPGAWPRVHAQREWVWISILDMRIAAVQPAVAGGRRRHHVRSAVGICGVHDCKHHRRDPSGGRRAQPRGRERPVSARNRRARERGDGGRFRRWRPCPRREERWSRGQPGSWSAPTWEAGKSACSSTATSERLHTQRHRSFRSFLPAASPPSRTHLSKPSTLPTTTTGNGVRRRGTRGLAAAELVRPSSLTTDLRTQWRFSVCSAR